MTNSETTADHRLAVLDGWRAVSILLVLATHLLPLGPKSWQVNAMTGPMGMALFFTLSGFLITRFLLYHDSVVDFIIRRVFRIVPLAWTGLLIALPLAGATADVWWRNLFFIANVPPAHLTEIAGHYWSLCLEMQFYVGIALLVAVLGVRGLYVVPLLGLAVTLHRVWEGAAIDIVTWQRADEILAGCTLVMVVDGRFGERPKVWLRKLNTPTLIVLLAMCSHPSTGWLNYLRPYAAALLVGSTLYGAWPPLMALLESRLFAYIAKISFALYVIHHILMHTWLGMADDKLMRYVKRPLLVAATFALAHLSTFHFEQRWIDLGKLFSARWNAWRGEAKPVTGSSGP